MSTRKDFLTASSLLALTSVSGQAEAASEQVPTFSFNEKVFSKRVSSQARHRNCFAIASIKGGEGLYAINNTYFTYTGSLGISPSNIFLIGVLYRITAVTLALNDSVWNEFLIPSLTSLPAVVRSDLDTVSIRSGNPCLHAKPNRPGNDASIESLSSRNSLFLVCNNAIGALALLIAPIIGRPVSDVYGRLVKGVVPGASLVPAGVWALHALQEKQFTYLQATS
jgi:hypothetical protein